MSGSIGLGKTALGHAATVVDNHQIDQPWFEQAMHGNSGATAVEHGVVEGFLNDPISGQLDIARQSLCRQGPGPVVYLEPHGEGRATLPHAIDQYGQRRREAKILEDRRV